jgi:hypothetical protein
MVTYCAAAERAWGTEVYQTRSRTASKSAVLQTCLRQNCPRWGESALDDRPASASSDTDSVPSLVVYIYIGVPGEQRWFPSMLRLANSKWRLQKSYSVFCSSQETSTVVFDDFKNAEHEFRIWQKNSVNPQQTPSTLVSLVEESITDSMCFRFTGKWNMFGLEKCDTVVKIWILKIPL